MSELPLYDRTGGQGQGRGVRDPVQVVGILRIRWWSHSTKGSMWGYPRPVLGAVDPLLEPFPGHLSPNIDTVSKK